VGGFILMALVGEWLCVRRELQDIPLVSRISTNPARKQSGMPALPLPTEDPDGGLPLRPRMRGGGGAAAQQRPAAAAAAGSAVQMSVLPPAGGGGAQAGGGGRDSGGGVPVMAGARSVLTATAQRQPKGGTMVSRTPSTTAASGPAVVPADAV
jgi:hypothetical protein